MGYVGLPLAVVFSEAGFNMAGFDLKKRLADLVVKNSVKMEPILWRII